MVICVTGHRPGRLPGYDYSNTYTEEKWKHFINIAKEILKKYRCGTAVTGMALGTDTAFAQAVLELKAEGYPIKLHCALPCLGQSSQWPKASVDLYDRILEQADSVHIVTEEPYKPYMMQKRNRYMVDMSDMVIALWNGSGGGTKNCVDYARQQYKPVIWIDPAKI